MNKNAVIAGLSASLIFMVLVYAYQDKENKKDLNHKQEVIEWYKIRYILATEEVNFGYRKLDSWGRSELKELFDQNQEFIDITGKISYPNLH